MIGPDTVELVFRDPILVDGDPVLDGDGRPTFTDRIVPKDGAKFTITGVSEPDTLPPVAVYSAKAALPVDADTLALKMKDAIRFEGLVYELDNDARPKKLLISGELHHVRAFCSREEPSRSTSEKVTIRARGAQDDRGARSPDGDPVDVMALAVDVGNTAERYGIEGTVEEADFTVVLALGSGLGDGDWITVRGKRCVARLQREFNQHAPRNVDVVVARYRGGGD